MNNLPRNMIYSRIFYSQKDTSSSLLGAYGRDKPMGTKKTNLYLWVHPRGMEYDMQVQAGSN